MRWVLAFLDWRSDDRFQKGDSRAISLLAACPYQLKGLRAYACRQARIFLGICDHFSGVWKGLELLGEHLNEPFYPIDLNPDAMELDGGDT